nr:serine/threonine-protein kinase [uncultured Thiodictyon sp.]
MRTLGRGAMGIVYEAHDPVIGRQVAIKLVRTHLLEGEERQDYVERFRREAQAAGRCNHPCIVTIFDFALHEGDPFLAMEYVDGVGLDTVLTQGERFAPTAAVHLIAQVLDALSCAHALGIVHRDIKPANILLLDGGRVKVTDFGIARLDSSELTQVGMVVGTPSYMSPEQSYGEGVDPRSDLFSTATVLKEMLIGRRSSGGRSFTDIAQGLQRIAPTGDVELATLAGPALQAAIARAMATRPQDRYDSAAAMTEALRLAIGEPASQAAPAALADQTVLAVRARGAAAGPALGSATLDPAVLSGVERRLAGHVGPIARYLVQTSIGTAASLEDLCETLAQRIDRPDARRQFMSEALELVNTDTARPGSAPPTTAAGQSHAGPASAIPPQEIARAQQALAQTLGPIARVLVQRTLAQARTGEELWDLLATHIGATGDRAAFLRRRDAG